MNTAGWVSGAFTESVVYTLLHSLWLGCVFALITACVMAATKKARSVVRYNLLLVVFAAFLLSLTAAFFYTWLSGPPADGPGTGVTELNVQQVIKLAREHALVIFRLWLLVILLQLIKLSLDLFRLDKLNKTAITGEASVWTKKIAEFSSLLGIKRKIKVAQSALINSPLVIGFLKPMILLPIGLINGLSEKEVEMVLLHELAHVRRGDFLVNILIRLARILLFFNPAIWWLCKLIAAEREHCCDDIAVSISGDKTGYVRTLVRFAETQERLPDLALALTSGMLGRVERMVTGRNRSLARIEVFLLSLIFVMALLLAGAHNPPSITSMAGPQLQNSATGKPPDKFQQEAKKKAEAEAIARNKKRRASP